VIKNLMKILGVEKPCHLLLYLISLLIPIASLVFIGCRHIKSCETYTEDVEITRVWIEHDSKASYYYATNGWEVYPLARIDYARITEGYTYSVTFRTCISGYRSFIKFNWGDDSQ